METHQNKQIITSVLVLMAVALVVGAIVVFGKKSNTTANDTTSSSTASSLGSSTDATPTATTNTTTDAGTSTQTSSSTSEYKDGTYTATADYYTPEDTDTIKVNLTVKDGSVTGVTATTTTSSRESRQYDSAFLNAYKSYVVGKKLSSLNLNRVSGASLTTDGFNNALDMIRQQAQA